MNKPVKQLPKQTREEALTSAAEQFLASCQDGDVKDLIDYYQDIFTEALKLPGKT